LAAVRSFYPEGHAHDAVLFWRTSTGRITRTIELPGKSVPGSADLLSISVNPAWNRTAVSGLDGRVRLWDIS
jgi:WD40 repeat protein